MPPLDDPIFQTFKIGHHHVPGIWRYMLPEDSEWLQLPEERLATCDNCPKVVTGEFSADCKCCTYFPEIPNFMLGLALKDPRSRPHVERLVRSGFSLPEGLQIPPERLVHTAAEYAGDRFGKSVSIRCPLIDEGHGACTVYPYRNSTCSTFFCYADHGEEGDKYWDKVESLVAQVEIALSQWAMEEVGIDPHMYCERQDEMAHRMSEATDKDTGGWSESFRRELFGDWFGREFEFFERCAELAMENREHLYEIACEFSTSVAFEFERAVHGMIPDENRSELEPVPDDPGDPVFIGDLWYKLQVATRRLWALPFNEGSLVLAETVEIAGNPQDDALSKHYKDKPWVALKAIEGKERKHRLRFLSDDEAGALRCFEQKQVLGERLLASAPLASLDDSRQFLAECMRQNILVPAP